MSKINFSQILKTDDYEIFSFLNLNRTINSKHVRKIRRSISIWGFFGTILVIKTDLFEGVTKNYIIDGQHRFKALEDLGYPIRYEIIDREFKTKAEIVSLIASLNSSSKSWALRDYMTAWGELGRSNYLIIQDKEKKSGLTPSALIPMYELAVDDSRQTNRFKNGEFKIPDISKSEQLIKTFQDCATYINFEHWMQERDFSRWVISNRPEHDKLLTICQSEEIPPEDLKERLNHLYYD